MGWRNERERTPSKATPPPPRSREIPGVGRVTTVVIDDPFLVFWQANQAKVMNVSYEAFLGYIHSPTDSRICDYFKKRENVAVVAQSDSGDILGFTCAEPDSKYAQTAYVAFSAVLPQYQGNGLYHDLRETLDQALREKGFHYKRADIRKANDFAEGYERIHQGRVISQRDFYDYMANEPMHEFVVRL